MFSKFFLKSKEMTVYGILTLLSGLTVADFQPFIAWLPDTIETPVVAVASFIIFTSAAALRAFWRGGKIVWKTGDATPKEEVAVIKAKERIESNEKNLAAAEALLKAAGRL